MNQISRDEIRSFMEKYHVDYSIADVTPTICALFGLNPPDVCGGQEIADVMSEKEKETWILEQVKILPEWQQEDFYRSIC